MGLTLIETWPIAGAFTIARGSRRQAKVVTAILKQGAYQGRGECVPYARYGETVESVSGAIEAIGDKLTSGITRTELLTLLPPGAARNAVDCALWDLEAKRANVRAWDLADIPPPRPVTTAYTLSLGSPETMEIAAHKAADRPLLKVKLGGEGDPDRIAAVRRAAPNATLIVDANEAWGQETLLDNLEACRKAGVKLIEQPLPAGQDEALRHVSAEALGNMLFCADESLHTAADLARLKGAYQAINIKLDKTGGLTEALTLYSLARAESFSIMIGCMVGTSLAMAPALLLASEADFVDLDGPLLLAKDREPGLRYEGSLVYPPETALWG